MKQGSSNHSFSNILGNGPTVKILEYLSIGKDFEYYITEIAKGTTVSRPQCYKELERMIQQKIVIKKKRIGNIQMYTINKSSEDAKAIINLFNVITFKKKKHKKYRAI